jgi:Uncharacterized protein conserved in bacteria
MESQLEKTQRVNLLLDCYSDLLTDKQNLYLSYYYKEDLSLSEIANELGVSRNAVFDNLKRAVHSLEKYEEKLELVKKHEERLALIDKIENEESINRDSLNDYLKMLKEI